ncbi:carbohydrate-binding module family 18 protein [Daldinia bambusicola]|nr:carbohydrate-binding module family 18 protein [Daldinia bambusicola]
MIKKILGCLAMAGLAIACSDDTPTNTTTTNRAPLRNVVYFDQYHTAIMPNRNVTAGITHVIMAFANSSLFVEETAGAYTPFMPLDQVRGMFDNGTQLGIAIGGWGDTAGFSKGALTEASRSAYAKNVAKMAETLGFDFVDIDWEYPGGNGADYKQTPNSNKTTEITTFPLFLQQIKNAIAPKQLSIAVPAKKQDTIAYTSEQAPAVFAAVDMVNLMSYDMMNRRDNTTSHHTSVKGAMKATKMYLDLGLPPSKLNLGFAFYAKYFQTPPGANCTQPIGCPVVAAENADGTDSGTSGAMTFEKAHVFPPAPPKDLLASADGTCGADAGKKCPAGTCCSQYGSCGSTAEYCGMGCQAAYGNCTAPDIVAAFVKALANSQFDKEEGGMWYWDAEASLFWTWDIPDMMIQKVFQIAVPENLGGVMAWSLGEDSANWARLISVATAVKVANKKIASQGSNAEGTSSPGPVMRLHGRRHGHRFAH